MKPLNIFFICIFSFQGILKAQDIPPGQQAQGYLESKNVTVDYATGLFHYKIPLYSLKSGNFELPISLNYVGKGVKIDDRPGLLGFNWTLNTGGIVTRTIRGGIADEASPEGYLWTSSKVNALPLETDIKSVNRRLRDGESDIFTAVFNGQSVNFIIRLSDDGKIYAEPLELTNVSIECESEGGTKINGWIITDEDGNRYIYRQIEWTSNINYEEAVSFNGIFNKAYVSSWYLNRIEPLNEEPIIYIYLEEVRELGEQQNINNTCYYSSYRSDYFYGRPMRERVLDFSKYQGDFDMNLSMARFFLNMYSLELRVIEQSEIFNKQVNGVYRVFSEGEVATRVSVTSRVIGQLADFSNIPLPSNGLLQALNDLYHAYSSNPSSNARQGAMYINFAKQCITRCLDEINNRVTEKTTENASGYTVRSPLLKGIRSSDKSIDFYYRNIGKEKIMDRIKLCDARKRRISEVGITTERILEKLSFFDKDSVKIQQMKMDYYICDWGEIDLWGYFRKEGDYHDNSFFPVLDTIYSKTYSLKTVTFPTGGKMFVDYQPNQVYNSAAENNETFNYGGLRVKSVIMQDALQGTSDTIQYHYPLPGNVVFDSYNNQEHINYPDFSDRVVHTRTQYNGAAFLSMGNNGVYYRYVTETFRGRGINAYWFNVPFRNFPDLLTRFPFAYWLYGLLLGEASYDNNGCLKRITKNKYYIDPGFMSPENDQMYFQTGHFVSGDTALGYSCILPQVKGYKYYMDEQILSDFYRRQQIVFLYRDNYVSSAISPYEDVYIPNIKPRTQVNLPEQNYRLLYGGKTLLKEQSEYRYESAVTVRPDWSDLSQKTTGVPYHKVEYFYDNLSKSQKPTRIVQADAAGDTHTIVTKRVTEMDDGADPVFAKMKQQNLLNPVVKQLELKNDRILKEVVYCYDVKETGEKCYIGLSQCYIRIPKSPEMYISTVTDGRVFNSGKENYILDKFYQYQQKQNSYFQTGVISRTDKSAICYDMFSNKVILESENTASNEIAARDINKYLLGADYDIEPEIVIVVNDLCKKLYTFREQLSKIIDLSPHSQEYINNSPNHRTVMSLIELIVFGEVDIDENKAFDLLRDARANNNQILYEFFDEYDKLIRTKPGLGMTCDELERLIFILKDSYIFTKEFLKCIPLLYRGYFSPEEKKVRLTSFPTNGILRLFVIAKKRDGFFRGIISNSQGNTWIHNSMPYTEHCALQIFEISLQSYTGITAVEIDETNGISYIALVPGDAVFEATSYNADGTLFCKFNQTGWMEHYEYDAAGRVLTVRDADGNLLKQYDYHTIQQ